MSAGTLIAIAIAYLLLTRRNGARTAAAPSPQPATATAGPGGTRIAIPGIGEYLNVPGGGVSISLDPRLFTGNSAAPQPEPEYYAGLTAPQLSTQYIPEALMDPPLALQAPGGQPDYV